MPERDGRPNAGTKIQYAWILQEILLFEQRSHITNFVFSKVFGALPNYSNIGCIRCCIFFGKFIELTFIY